jgi:hypothetical protein
MTGLVLEVTRGSNLDLRYIIDDDGEPVDMTGWTVDWVDIQPPALAEAVAVTILAPTFGEVQITLPWSDLWPKSPAAQIRIRWRLSGLPDAAIPEVSVLLT